MVSNRIMNTTEGCKCCLPLFNHRGPKMADNLLFLFFVETKKMWYVDMGSHMVGKYIYQVVKAKGL